MKFLPTILSCALLLLSSCGEPERSPSETAARSAEAAVTAMNEQQYDEAERLIAESIEFHAAENNEAKLAENYATLSSIQLLAGKRSAALETLRALRAIFQHGADRTAELQTMLQMGRIAFQLGKKNESYSLLKEAYNNAKLFRLEQIALRAALELAHLSGADRRFGTAFQFADIAEQLAQQLNNTAQQVEARTIHIRMLASTGNIPGAVMLFRTTDAIQRTSTAVNEPYFLKECGNIFSDAKEWTNAKQCYERILRLADHDPRYRHSAEVLDALVGLGTVYYDNYAYGEAQGYFSRAYDIAKSSGNSIMQGYILLLTGDCLAKRSAVSASQELEIRAAQLYEQAQTIFSRNNFGIGEAAALHRLAALNELTGNGHAAVALYKRSSDRLTETGYDPAPYMLPFSPARLLPTAGETPVFDLNRRLIVRLAESGRFAEAYGVLSASRAADLRDALFAAPPALGDPERRDVFQQLTATFSDAQRNLLETYHWASAPGKMKNRSVAAKLQQHGTLLRSKFQSDAVTAAQSFPVFSFLAPPSVSSPSMIASSLPSGITMVEYCLSENDVWAFILRPEEEVAAVKISSFGFVLRKKMERLIEVLSAEDSSSPDAVRLSGELYQFFIAPIEKYLSRQLIIIPPSGVPAFPFHQLMKNGTTLAEKIPLSYLPHSLFALSRARFPKFINSIAAFGFTTDTRWGLEFELRDIRSFFGNTQININQSATVQRLEGSVGEIVQISAPFSMDADNTAFVQLSDGSMSKTAARVPVTLFARLHPFPIVYLTDVRRTENAVTDLHAIYWMLNGSAAVIANRLPITPNTGKTFTAHWYSALTASPDPGKAYRSGLTHLSRKKDLSNGFAGAAYFYYGVR